MAEKSDFEQTGDILQIALPISSFALTYLKSEQDDKPWKSYLYPFLKSFSVGLVAVHAQKVTFGKERPNGDNKRSFPSGHSFSAFSGAAFNHSLYGYRLGIPSYLTAAVVGLSRIDAKQHFADDVLAGASIAMLSNWYFTETMTGSNENIRPLILAGQDSTMVGVTGSTDSFLKDKHLKKSKFIFNYNFGPSDINKVEISQQSLAPTELTDIPREKEHISTSQLNLEYLLASTDSTYLNFHPFEWINRGLLKNNLSFDGNSFLTGESVITDWVQYNLDLGYRYRPKLHSSWDISFGGGALLSYTKLSIQRQDKTQRSEKSQLGILPLAEIRIFPKLTKQLTVGFSCAGMLGSDQRMSRLTFASLYRMSQRWGINLQYSMLSQKTKLDTLSMENQQNTVWLGLSYHYL